MLTESEIILLNLIKNEDYFLKTLPYLDSSMFTSEGERVVFKHIKEYHEKYQRQTNVNTLIIDISNDKSLTDIGAEQVSQVLNNIKNNYENEYEFDWLLDMSEEYCKSISTYNVLNEAMGYHNTPDGFEKLGSISEKLNEALAFGFDDSIGHDYLQDFQSRYDYYTSTTSKIPFALESFNRITNNGFAKKTLNIVLAGPHCVDENTPVNIRIKFHDDDLLDKFENIAIKRIEWYLNSDEIEYVEIDTPDGWQKVSAFHEMGTYKGYWAHCERLQLSVKVSHKHKFETPDGWKTVDKIMAEGGKCEILMKNGKFEKCTITPTDIDCRIVDITVDYYKHRYYANGFSSHNCGKTGLMCKWAADHLKLGQNVLYVSLEMEEFKIAQRIDSNLLGFPINDLENGKIDIKRFENKVMEMRKQTLGRLMIKQLEGVNVNHLKAYLKDLRTKERFEPDIIYVDYMSLLNSTKASLKNHNSYTVLKSVSEELRGLAIQEDLVVITAAQFNRGAGQDPDMDDISESYGIAMTADFLLGLSKPIDQEIEGIFCKVIKSRYSNKDGFKQFRLGFDPETVNYYDTTYNDQKEAKQPAINNDSAKGKGFSKFKFN